METISKAEFEFEVVVAGPDEADYKLPVNFKHIKTDDIKPVQCLEIAWRETQYDLIMCMGDDHHFWPAGGGLDVLLQECYDNDGSAILPTFRDCGHNRLLTFNKLPGAPLASLNAALFDKRWLTCGIDKRFIGSFWDYDVGMRLLEGGHDIIKSKSVICVEHRVKTFHGVNLCHACKHHDWPSLHKMWCRPIKENETVPSDDVWCCSGKLDVLSRHRLDEVMEFDSKDILIESQGPKEVPARTWK